MKHNQLTSRLGTRLVFYSRYIQLQSGWHSRKKRYQPAIIVLTGFMGSGKSTLGSYLANTMGAMFLDTDLELEKQEGKSISRMFEEYGEAGFRRREEALIQNIFETARVTAGSTSGDTKRPLVVAIGGGAVISPKTRTLLKKSRILVVWLDTNYKIITERLKRTTDRPIFERMKHTLTFKRLYQKRLRLYKSCAKIRLYGNGTTSTIIMRQADV